MKMPDAPVILTQPAKLEAMMFQVLVLNSAFTWGPDTIQYLQQLKRQSKVLACKASVHLGFAHQLLPREFDRTSICMDHQLLF